MKKTNISKFIAVGLCICALTGCGASPDEKPDTSNPIVNSNTTLNKQLGSVTNITTGSISDVKKQSDVYLYGEFADTLHFNATKVVVARWE